MADGYDPEFLSTPLPLPASPRAGPVLDQSDLVDVRRGRLAVPPLGRFRTFQVPVAEIARLKGLDLGRMPDADVLAKREMRRREWTPLASRDDILL